MKKTMSVKKWVVMTLKEYGKLVFEEPWICLFLTQNRLKSEGKWFPSKDNTEKI